MSSIDDFLPKYPNIENGDDDLFNPYEENFYSTIFHKKEFYQDKLDAIEAKPEKPGNPMKHQKLIATFLSSYTPYDSLLLVHEPGSGKTCSAVTTIEKIKSELSSIKGALILVKGERLIPNFV